MIIISAAASSMDADETTVTVRTEAEEILRVGDLLTLELNDRTRLQRPITGMFRDWKKWIKGKEHISQIHDGEWAECIVHNVDAGRIHTQLTCYDDELAAMSEDAVTAQAVLPS